MYILLNGAFGIGKSTVARELRRALPSAAIADPEWIGVLLQRVARRHRADFQHDPIWRRLAVVWVRLRRGFGSTVIVPMAFSELRYLNEITTGLRASGEPVFHFCLTAPLEIVRERLAARGQPLSDTRYAWVHRRAAECCDAHADPRFTERVSTISTSPSAVAQLIAARLKRPPSNEKL